MPDKARDKSGYTPEDTELIVSTCLTVAVTLGAYMDDLVIVGGLVPTLLIDPSRDAEPEELHPGTTDLDLGLSLVVLDESRYAAISERLRAEGFEPDHNEMGNPTVQRWTRDHLTVDFLIPPPPDGEGAGRIHKLEGDFGAIITPGLELAFDERVSVTLEGKTLSGEKVVRDVGVCGPGAFVILKALAFGDRAEPKDAFDLVYTLEHSPGGAAAVARQIRSHHIKHPDVTELAIGKLRRDFGSVNAIGPLRAADFATTDETEHDDAAADAHGFVDDLLNSVGL